MDEKFNIEQKVVEMLKTVFDPEIPVNVYDLGLIYKIDVTDDFDVNIDMTLTAPNCPAADFIIEDIRNPPYRTLVGGYMGCLLVDERLDIYLVIQFLVGQFALRPFESLQKRPPVVQIVYIQMEHAADALGIGILERDVLHGEDVIFETVLCLRRFRVRRGRTDDDQIAFAERLRTAV